MQTLTRVFNQIAEIENVFIPLSDGTKLAARIWLPADAEQTPVPAILEYLPYRKRDRTTDRDALNHPYFAGHGYAGVRVDIRGSGDSEGVLRGEYLKQEQDDALEVLDWLIAQPWCSGAVGMIGISWGGFNGLQVAARRHPALKAVISICSTDDRYADDIHFMGGCLLLDKLSWYSTMFSLNTAPPDPLLVGEKWRDMWLQRLDGSTFWFEDWLKHQRRDEFYTHGSVCEDFSAIECPVYAVGGWADGYSNAVFRLLECLKCPRKGLIGPWAHKYPHVAKPGPQIGFLQECIRWWDQWLKGKNTGIMEEPMFRVWMQEPFPPRPYYDNRPGRWIAEQAWPPAHPERKQLHLGVNTLLETDEAASQASLILHPRQTVGLAAGRWCPYGVTPDQPQDQRLEEGGQLLFDSQPLERDIEILGFPMLDLKLSADQPQALIAATLCEILADGSVTRISYGMLNLTHRGGHEKPVALTPGVPTKIKLQLNGIAHRFATGNRIRVALSTSYWPIAWSSPCAAALKFDLGECRLSLPTRQPREADKTLPDFPRPEHAPPLEPNMLEGERNAWTICHDLYTDVTTVRRIENEGVRRYEGHGLVAGGWRESRYSIKPDDPLSARADIRSKRQYSRDDWKVSSETRIVMWSTRTHFVVRASLTAYEKEERAFARSWSLEIPRDHV
jgi:hypothetical protein